MTDISGKPDASQETRVTAIGNAGFLVTCGTTRLVFDPLPGLFSVDQWIAREVRGVAPGESSGTTAGATSVILITHDHWDHFDAAGVAGLAQRMGSVVVGSAAVSRKLAGRLAPERIVTQEPSGIGAMAEAHIGDVEILTVRTPHGQRHNSYRVECSGVRLFHDGDNEHTEVLDGSRLMGLDAVMMAPWQGSGWAEFLDAIAPRHWFLMHMDEDEWKQHDRGEFFPGLCDHVPGGLVALRPGETFSIRKGP